MITVLQIGWCDPRLSFGGVESIMAGLTNHLPSLGIRVVVKSLPSMNPGFISIGRSTNELPYVRFARELQGVIEEERVDLVHSHNIHRPNGSGIAQEVARTCQMHGIPHVSTIHDCALPSSKSETTTTKDALNGAWCVATSFFNARQLASGYAVKTREIIEPGVNFYQTPPRLEAEHVKAVCSPGRLTPAKGLGDAVMIVGHLSRVLGPLSILLSSCTVPHFGQSTEYVRYLETLAEAFPNLTMRFLESSAKPEHLFLQSGATICTPVGVEGFSLVPLESLACARPSVVFPNGGMDWTRDCKSIVRVNQRKATEMLAALESMLTSTEKWQVRLHGEYEGLKKRYDMPVMACHYKTIYEKAIKSKRQPRRTLWFGNSSEGQ